MKPIKKFKRLAKKAIKIRDNKELTWEEKFFLIFSDEIGDKIDETGIDIKWQYVTSDTTAEEDVRAYVDAVERKLKLMKAMKKTKCKVVILLVERC